VEVLMTGVTTFHEVMRGHVRLHDPGADPPRRRQLRLALVVEAPGVMHPWSDVVAVASGRLFVPGWCDEPVHGTLRIAPMAARRIHYRIAFILPDGRRCELNGWKSLTVFRPLWSMTHLPATITDESGAVVAEAWLRFDLRRDLIPFLGNFRHSRHREPERGRVP